MSAVIQKTLALVSVAVVGAITTTNQHASSTVPVGVMAQPTTKQTLNQPTTTKSWRNSLNKFNNFNKKKQTLNHRRMILQDGEDEKQEQNNEEITQDNVSDNSDESTPPQYFQKEVLVPAGDSDTSSPPLQFGDEVTVHYVGTLASDGTQFDSSRERDMPFTFKLGLGEVIPCWDEGVASMLVGEKAVLTCAPEYAYGEAGSPPTIPPNAELKFEVELLSASKGDAENAFDDFPFPPWLEDGDKEAFLADFFSYYNDNPEEQPAAWMNMDGYEPQEIPEGGVSHENEGESKGLEVVDYVMGDFDGGFYIEGATVSLRILNATNAVDGTVLAKDVSVNYKVDDAGVKEVGMWPALDAGLGGMYPIASGGMRFVSVPLHLAGMIDLNSTTDVDGMPAKVPAGMSGLFKVPEGEVGSVDFVVQMESVIMPEEMEMESDDTAAAAADDDDDSEEEEEESEEEETEEQEEKEEEQGQEEKEEEEQDDDEDQESFVDDNKRIK